MAVVNTLIGNIKGPKGDTGAAGIPGATGATGADATVSVGSTTTVPYGQAARVTNTGTPGAAVLNFTIPQGRPGEQTTKLDALTLDALTEPSTQFPVPAVGDNGSTLFGKISKWFSDMVALVATKLNAANVVNNLTTTSSGYALDARQGKALSDDISTLSSTVSGLYAGAAVADANSAPLGFSCFGTETANNPFSFWCSALTIRGNAPAYTQQIVFPWSVGETKLAYRVMDGGTWYAWHYINFSS